MAFLKNNKYTNQIKILPNINIIVVFIVHDNQLASKAGYGLCSKKKIKMLLENDFKILTSPLTTSAQKYLKPKQIGGQAFNILVV